jgi:hypothetical protein
MNTYNDTIASFTLSALDDNKQVLRTFVYGSNYRSYMVEQEQLSEFKLNKSGDNFIKQAYDYLKTLSEYQGAVDC